MSDELVGFEAMKSEYANDSYFGNNDAIPSIQYHAGLYSIEDFLLIDGFKGSRLCIPLGSRQ